MSRRRRSPPRSAAAPSSLHDVIEQAFDAFGDELSALTGERVLLDWSADHTEFYACVASSVLEEDTLDEEEPTLPAPPRQPGSRAPADPFLNAAPPWPPSPRSPPRRQDN